MNPTPWNLFPRGNVPRGPRYLFLCPVEKSEVRLMQGRKRLSGITPWAGVMVVVLMSIHRGAQAKQGNIASHNPQKASFYCPISSSAVTSNHCRHVTAAASWPSVSLGGQTLERFTGKCRLLQTGFNQPACWPWHLARQGPR